MFILKCLKIVFFLTLNGNNLKKISKSNIFCKNKVHVYLYENIYNIRLLKQNKKKERKYKEKC